MISNNSDFLFIYEAIQCNPNGDPDQENKPRMDYDTNTNLVTDTRVKRYIRDYFKQDGKEIFVDLEGESKVTMDDKLRGVISRIWDKDEKMKSLIANNDLFEKYLTLKEEKFEDTVKKLVSKKPENKQVNLAILSGLVKQQFVDIRLFGSAFAVDGFNRSMTGPIQLNWGYSLNKVYLMDSNTIASIMNDGNSTFGKDYRVKYSLISFHGTINKAASKTTGMTDADIATFRKAIWQSIAANPTRTKLNQYPKFYLEIVYNEGFHNGCFGDLRSYISTNPKYKNDNKSERIDEREVRGLGDLEIEGIKALIQKIKTYEEDGKQVVHDVIIRTSPDMAKYL